MSSTRQVTVQLSRYLPSMALMSFALSLLALTTPIYMMQVFDRILSTGSMQSLAALTVIAVFALGAAALLERARSVVLVRASQWMDTTLCASLLPKVDPKNSLNVTQDLSLLRGAICGRSATMVLDMPWTPIFLIPLVLLSPWFGVLAALLAGILILLAMH
ncbi:MAG: hypothetical protein AAGH60_06365, partial [Pseudomonadota bacterium]